MFIDFDDRIQCERCRCWRREFWIENDGSLCISCIAKERLILFARIKQIEIDNPPPAEKK